MAVPALETAPVLSTPETHIFEDPTPVLDVSNLPRLSDEQISLTYEVERTVREIRAGRRERIALQFPDQMLVDAPRVYEALTKGLKNARNTTNEVTSSSKPPVDAAEVEISTQLEETSINEDSNTEERLFILADTSYGACCVDEVAAEHVDADVVVHYGRSCLSPPSRLPVIYVFTAPSLDLDHVASTFKQTYPDTQQKIILMADIPYAHHIPPLQSRLQRDGYTHTFATELLHNPSSLLPNRTTPPDTPSSPDTLRDHHLFHISSPPQALLLTLYSRVSTIHIYPTTTPPPAAAIPATSTPALRRRYALLSTLPSAAVLGILINTLSVKNYMTVLAHVQSLIAAAGKKSYTFVVGKVNAAKVANFSEVEAWVVIGCWESGGDVEGSEGSEEDGGEDESEPPDFDLRTGRYVSRSRPLRRRGKRRGGEGQGESMALTKRADGELATINGVVSPGAEYLRSNRTWQGLGSDYHQDEGVEEGPDRAARMEEGRTGIAGGYTVGDDAEVR
ncbi:diphthamide biosynthesis protein [Polyplosphaeria fusca]|uniref:2-(3-amino-3-carboxypropyl)histidine synthase subunit 2 n=1 Tax=Polyplosphaeria fusca TaxID=682080 RepID=A0A9P4QZF2_9PLEO|nr:diphthamide biosynthesis protein [Polyplosphaeria fusca]